MYDHQNHTTGGKMTGSVHSLVTRIRSGAIEMNPGPETQQQTDDTPARRTRQATLRDAPFDIWGGGGAGKILKKIVCRHKSQKKKVC